MAVRDRTRLTGPLASHKHEEGGPQAAFFVYGPIYQVEHKQLRGLEVPKIRGIVKAKRTLVRESSGSREDSVPRALSADEQFRRPAGRRN